MRGLGANVVNNVVGSGIFVLPAVVAATLGASAIVAYVICAIAIGLIGISFAEAGSRVSAPGGTYAYAEAAFGPFVGFQSGVLFWLSQVSASAAVAAVFVGALAAVFPPLATPALHSATIVLLYGALALVNIRGVRSGMRAVEVLTVAKVLPLVILVVAGAFVMHPANLVWKSLPSFAHAGSASLVLIFAFMGVEGAVTSSGEVSNPSRTVPRAIFLGLGAVSLLYIAVQLVSQGVLGTDLALNTSAPLVTVARRVLGTGGAGLLAAGAAISAFGYVSGDILATPRLLFAFARNGFLPARLGAVNARFHTPAAAIIAHVIICVLLALTGTFESLVVLSTVAMLLVYFATCLASIELRRRGVTSDGPPFTVAGGATVPLLACAVVVWMLTSASRREFIAVGVTVVVATVLYGIRMMARRT